MDPEKISHYKILQKLGAGGMGVVYLAEDMKLGRKVAIKILSYEFTTNKDRLNRFEQEASAASNLNHPNILTIHEVGDDDGRHYIATEYIDGVTLRRKMVASQLQIPEGTLSSRLATAHAMLAKRLSRHGFALSSASLATLLGQTGVSASLPAAVVTSTIQTAALVAATNGGVASVVSAKVIALTESVMKAMMFTKIKIATATLLIIGLASNLFTSTFVSKTLFEMALGRRQQVATLSI